MRAIARARVTAEDVVAVYGCGAVGLGAAITAHAAAGRVVYIGYAK